MDAPSDYIDTPLARFCVERLAPNPTNEHRSLRRPFLAIGDFVSWPYLVGANRETHERYQKDRLFILLGMKADGQVCLDASGIELELAPGQSVDLRHNDEDIRVTLVAFSSKSVLHALERLH